MVMEPRFEPCRELGRTGFRASILGIGDVADRRIETETLVATVRRAIDAGVNLVDTAPSYEDGYSEEIVGRALRGVRERIFLVDKIDDLDAAVRPQVESSLRRLEIDHADALIFHGVSTLAALGRLSAAGGGFDQLSACIRDGMARFRGISSHHPEVLRVAIEAGLCDVVLFPIGPFVDSRYIEEVLPLARRQGAGTICFKAFGAGKLLGDTFGYNTPIRSSAPTECSEGDPAGPEARLPHLSVRECLHYTLTLDPDVVLLGLSDRAEQDAAFEAAASFQPLGPDEMERIRLRAAEARVGKGPCWWNPDPEA